ncbi:Kelch repeat-containing protein [Cavenderia fasciculata]|uniref:Kelch repeat-containing protein n=1 Tax=Cavenderia fasciculata TaxID=261658 RepID=F4QE47_CACFS|nr:Kelch repeat-containing protein [Cavenderia fasciculata]EGG13994.1 Kelch repeat-containing protein [Cavenderia fasciculata]|eukprot:XP_004350702.1 Kelch repeat-containing protein [Cavenderia fasciculata]
MEGNRKLVNIHRQDINNNNQNNNNRNYEDQMISTLAISPDTNNNCNNNNNNNNRKERNFMELPNEVTLRIISLLDPNDIGNICQTNRTLNMFCEENIVWKAVCKRKWAHSPIFKRRPINSWKDYYSKKLTLMSDKNGLCWIEIKPSGERPSPRYQNTSTVVGKYIYYIGGQEIPEKRFNDIFRFDTESYTFERVIPRHGFPPNFARHSAVSIDHRIFTFGGFNGISKHFNLCIFDTKLESWEYIESRGETPIPRTNHSATVIGKYMYIYGGMYKGNNNQLIFLDDLFCLDTETLIWRKIYAKGDIPPAKCGHKLMTFDNKLLLFGGGYGLEWEKKYNDVHIYDPLFNTWTKVNVKGNAPVCTFTIVFNAGPFMFVFGGQSLSDDSLTNDLYLLDTVNMEWSRIDAPSAPHPRDMGSGNMVGSTMFMFGGYNGSAIDELHALKMEKRLELLLPSTRLSPIS